MEATKVFRSAERNCDLRPSSSAMRAACTNCTDDVNITTSTWPATSARTAACNGPSICVERLYDLAPGVWLGNCDRDRNIKLAHDSGGFWSTHDNFRSGKR